MRTMKGILWSLATLAAIAVALFAMLGMFWVLEIAPLVLFVGMTIVYGILSRSTKSSSQSASVNQSKDRSRFL